MAETANAPETTPKPAENAPPPAAPDPYAGMSAEDRAAAVAIDESWKNASPAQRIVWAREINESLTRKQAEAAAKRDTPPAPAKEEEAGEPESELAVLKREFSELKASLRAEAETKKQQQQVEEFFAMVDDEIGRVEELKGKPKLRMMIRNAAAGKSVTTKVADVRAMVKGMADELLEETREEREAWVAAKKNVRDSGGEGRGGRGAAAEKIDIKPGDLSRGNLAKLAKAKLLGR